MTTRFLCKCQIKSVLSQLISSKWLKYTGDSSIVYISMVHNTKKCLNYLLKYISKPPSYYDPEKLVEYLIAIRGTRRIRAYGIFYNFRIFEKHTFKCIYCGSGIHYKKIIPVFELKDSMISFKEAYETDK